MSDAQLNYHSNVLKSYVVPRTANVFDPVYDGYGVRLAWVFGNEADEGLCPYYKVGKCFHCDIGAGEGTTFDPTDNHLRLRWLSKYYEQIMPEVSHLVIYNSGSVLNPREMSPSFLDDLMIWTTQWPGIRVVSIDSREAFVTKPVLARLSGLLGPHRSVRPIIGLESSSDEIRNTILQKMMPRSAFERAVREIGATVKLFGKDRIGLDVNILVGGPGTTIETSVDDALTTFLYVSERSKESNVQIDVNLHGYYPSARGQTLFLNHPRCPPATVAAAARAIVRVAKQMSIRAQVFIGWQDEGHDQQPDRRHRELAAAKEIFDQFNRTQSAEVLNSLSAL